MAVEFKKLVESGKVDKILLPEREGNPNVSVHIKAGIDVKKYADGLTEEGTISDVYQIEGNIIRGFMPAVYVPLLAQRPEVEKINSSYWELRPNLKPSFC